MPDGPSDRLQVSFVRSGGFGGLRLATELGGDQLTDEEAAVLRSLLSTSGGADEAQGTRTRGADRFRYDLTIRDGGDSRTLSLSDAELTPELRPLVDRLEAHARNRSAS
jgi:hypothetical protein